MPRATPGKSATEMARLLRQWGCELLRMSGGHGIWRAPNGEQFVSCGEGRSTMPTFKQVKQASNALGVTVEQFFAGPKKGNRP